MNNETPVPKGKRRYQCAACKTTLDRHHAPTFRCTCDGKFKLLPILPPE